MAKHRAEHGKSAPTSGSKSAKPRHRRRSNRPVVIVPAVAVALVAGAGVATAVADSGSNIIDLGDANVTMSSTAAVLASRQGLDTSRGGSRILLYGRPSDVLS